MPNEATSSGPTVPFPQGGVENTVTSNPGVAPTQIFPQVNFEKDKPAPKPAAFTPEIPGVVIEGELGRGGMGIVYRGKQPYIDRRVAVKVLLPSNAGLGAQEFVERFQREARILAGLAHPNIVACYAADVTPKGDCYLVMEFVDGSNLQQLVQKQGPLPEAHALELTRDLSLALEHARSQGIIHRDVKPENVLLAKFDKAAAGAFGFTAKLVDLGLARPVVGSEQESGPQITVKGTVLGTPSTMAPEQFEDPEGVDYRADIYGLGCVLHYVLTGKAAFADKSLAQLLLKKSQGQIPDPALLRPDLSKEVVALVRKMLMPQKTDRPASYEEIVNTCEQLLEKAASGGTAVNARKRMTGLMPKPVETESVTIAIGKEDVPAGSRSKAPVAVVALLLVAVGGGGAIFATRTPGPPIIGPMTPKPASPAPAPTLTVPNFDTAEKLTEPDELLHVAFKNKDWVSDPRSAFGAAEACTITGSERGRLSRAIPGSPPWQLTGKVGMERASACTVRLDLEGGSAYGLVIRKLGTVSFRVSKFDAQLIETSIENLAGSMTLAPVLDFEVTVLEGGAFFRLGTKRVGPVRLDTPSERPVGFSFEFAPQDRQEVVDFKELVIHRLKKP